ncbi:hypothetical protein KPSA3_04291 [Pseudomonas syringae pv. actinidiae]|uniref:Uncharacterized protein n=1 Tax=Pseudomonas syringae pv. actinidiae TaxID=103796 RepID=A0AAN4Q7G5_PSESF|nr:hypothetical protein KPSA3_04291 [Pseudomonas syringae pv. actinidiae]
MQQGAEQLFGLTKLIDVRRIDEIAPASAYALNIASLTTGSAP